MRYNPQPLLGAVPQDPRKRRPLVPEEYPYEPEVLEAPEELPDLPVRPSIPFVPLTPGLQRPTGPDTIEPTPFRSLGQFRQWYAGVPVQGGRVTEPEWQPPDYMPGDVIPPAPEWGKRTPTYSRLNPPPPRVFARQPVTAPAGPQPVQGPTQFTQQQMAAAANQPRFFDVARQQLAQARQARTQRPGATTPEQVARLGVTANQPVQAPSPSAITPTPTGGRRSIFEVAGAPVGQPGTAFVQQGPQGAARDKYQQQYTLPQAMQNAATAMNRQGSVTAAPQFLSQTGIQQAAEGTLLNRQWRDVPRDMGLAIAAGIPRIGAGFASLADMIGRTSAAAPVGQPGTSYAADTTRPAAPTSFGQTARSLEQASEGLLGARSQSIQQREQILNADLERQQDDALGQVATYAAAIYKDPALVEKAILSNLPQIFPALAAGKIASVAGTGAALAARVGTGALMGGADAVNSIYETNKQALLGRGLPEAEADREAFRQAIIGAPIGAAMGGLAAGTGFEAGFSGGGLGARLGQGMRKIASRIPQGLARGATEIATEIPEETIPQIVGNIQSGQPAMRNVGRTAAETAIATGPFAIAAGVGGGAAKNPDVLQDETYGPFRYRPAPNTFPPAPLSFVPGVPRERQGPGFQMTGEGRQFTYTTTAEPQGPQPQLGLPPAPTRLALPPAPTPQRPQSQGIDARELIYQGPGSAYALSTLETPGERYGKRAAPVVLREVLGPGQRASAEENMGLLEEMELARQKGKSRAVTLRRATGSSEGGGKFGNIARAGMKAPTHGLEPLKKAYGIPEDMNRYDAYEQIVGNLAAEMGEIAGRDFTINDVESATTIGTAIRKGKGIPAGVTPEVEGNIWGRWYEKYGKRYGLTPDDMQSVVSAVFGKGAGSLMNNEAVQLTLVGDTGPGVAKKVQSVIRRDMAYMLGFDTKDPNYKEFSLASMSPDMWRLWARSYGFDNEKIYPGVMRDLEAMIGAAPVLQEMDKEGGPYTADRTRVYPRRGTPPAPQPSAPSGPLAPTPSRPVAPSGTGFPRPPLSFVPGVPSRRQGPGFQLTGKGRGFRYTTTAQPQGPMPPGPLMVVDNEREERGQARQTLERLRKKSPFARGRQAERERAEAAMKGRRPAPPPAEPGPVTPPPKPPVAPPAPSGATGSATGSVTGSVTPPKTPRQLLADAGWTAENSQLFTGPNDESIEYDDGSTGRAKGWYYIDASGNRTAYGSAKEAIESVLGQPKGAPTRPAAPTQPEQPKTTKKGQAKAPKAETAPPVTETASPKPRRPKKTTEPTPAPAKPAPAPEAAPKAAKEQAPPMSPEDIERLVVKGMSQLDRAAMNGGLVSLTELRDLLKDKFPTIADFDNAILALVKQNENVTLHRYTYGYGFGPLSRTEQDKLVTDERGNRFIGIALRDTYKPPTTTKTAPETAPKAAKTGKATTAQPVSAEDKAMLEDIDKNGKKTKQRKRIETEYGEKGKKAIFVENNINEILKEAEESGKVTKQCP